MPDMCSTSVPNKQDIAYQSANSSNYPIGVSIDNQICFIHKVEFEFLPEARLTHMRNFFQFFFASQTGLSNARIKLASGASQSQLSQNTSRRSTYSET